MSAKFLTSWEMLQIEYALKEKLSKFIVIEDSDEVVKKKLFDLFTLIAKANTIQVQS